MNNVVLVGRLTKDPELIDLANDQTRKKTVITLAVTRNYKNSEGEYETDFLRCVLWNAIASSTCEYCHKGDIVGIKGRLETSVYEDEKKEKNYFTEVVVEKITFLSSTKKSEPN